MSSEFNDPCMPKQIIAASFDSHVEHLLQFSDYQTPEMRFKIAMAKELFVREIITWPTQYYVSEALQISTSDLYELLHRGHTPDVRQIELVECPMSQNCHLSTAYHWLMMPELEIWSGYSDQTNYHSWLYNPTTQTVYEPTPIKRDYYFGHCVLHASDYFCTLLPSILELFKDEKKRPKSWNEFERKLASFFETGKPD